MLAICLLAHPAAARQYEDAEVANAQGDYATAMQLVRLLVEQGDTLTWYRKAAELGSTDAQYKLGTMYMNGYGAPQDRAEAIKWFSLAAEHGNANAKNNFNYMFVTGKGVPQDRAEALKWLEPAAERGEAAAQADLGAIYLFGAGGPVDYAEALKWLRPAAEHGSSIAQAMLGGMYVDGQGVPVDSAEALRWLRPAAEHGNSIAQISLSYMYFFGEGVARDYMQAHMWVDLAVGTLATASDLPVRDLAIKLRDERVAVEMKPEEIAEAQRLAREWLTAHLFLKTSGAQGQTFHGYECTVDCSGHEAGYEWAERNEITDPDDCDGKSQSFIEGCRAWADEDSTIEEGSDESDDWAKLAERPRPSPRTSSFLIAAIERAT